MIESYSTSTGVGKGKSHKSSTATLTWNGFLLLLQLAAKQRRTTRENNHQANSVEQSIYQFLLCLSLLSSSRRKRPTSYHHSHCCAKDSRRIQRSSCCKMAWASSIKSSTPSSPIQAPDQASSSASALNQSSDRSLLLSRASIGEVQQRKHSPTASSHLAQLLMSCGHNSPLPNIQCSTRNTTRNPISRIIYLLSHQQPPHSVIHSQHCKHVQTCNRPGSHSRNSRLSNFNVSQQSAASTLSAQ